MSSEGMKNKEGVQEQGQNKNAGMKKKAQCDLCKLSYSTEKELTEHLLSLMHHTKMEDKEDNPVHVCTLCIVNCSDMAEYRRHIALDSHQKKLSKIRGSDHEQEGTGKNEKRKSGSKGSKPPLSHAEQNDYFGNGNLRCPRNKFAPKVSQQGWNPRSRPPRFGSDNPNYQWQKNVHSRNRWSHDDEIEERNYKSRDNPDCRPEKKNRRPWESDAYFVYENERTGRQKPWQQNQWSKRMDMQHFDNSGFEFPFQDESPQYMDFTSDDPHSYWDDYSLSQREQYLAGMDSSYPFNRSSPRYQYQQSRVPNDYHFPRPEDIRDRKRPRNEDDVQESLAKSSRPIDHSFDDNIPVKDVPEGRRETRTAQVTQNQKDKTRTLNDIQKQQASIDDASNNILERAERLCKELREKREASQAHRKNLLKKQEQEFINEKMHALVEKQRSYLKGHIKEPETIHRDENYDSGVSSTSTQQSKSNDGVSSVSASFRSSHTSSQSSSKPVSHGKSLEEIRRSIEKSVLDDADRSQTTNKSALASRRKQRTYSGGDTGRLLSKPSPKPQLTKDSLKKMVNAPRSRDERVQLAKLLQSRDGHKPGHSPTPRVGLQLEGLHDSAVISCEGTTDVDNGTATAQTIKLEDLAENVRQQILDLIGGDIEGSVVNKSDIDIGTSQSRGSAGEISASPKHNEVIVLSDVQDKSGDNSKNKPHYRDKRAFSAGSRSDDSVKLKKTKKTVVRSTGSTKHVPRGAVQASLVEQLHKSEVIVSDSESDVEVVSCSSDKDSGNRERVGRENYAPKSYEESHSLTTKENGFKPTYSLAISSSPKEVHVSNKMTRSDDASTAPAQCSSQLTSDNVREKFPTIMGFLGNEKISPAEVEHERISSNLGSAGQRLLQQSLDLTTTASCVVISPPTESVLQMSSSQVLMSPAIPSSSLPERISHQINETPISKETHTAPRPTLPPSLWLTGRSHSPPTSANRETISTATIETTPAAVSTTLDLTNRSPSNHSEMNEHCLTESHTTPKTSSSLSALLSTSEHFDLTASLGYPRRDHIQSTDLPNDFSSTLGSTALREKAFSPSSGGQESYVSNFDRRDSQHFVAEKMTVDPSGTNEETSSQAMSDLLVLSEREEEIKQEMMSMELRLTRLHRLLEQAVVQINKCTERRNQLLEEEQDISKRRLSLLRGATSASSRQSLRSDTSDAHNISFASDTPTHDSLHTDRSGQSQNPAHTASTSSATLLGRSSRLSSIEKLDDSPGTSLSKEDWLAKFSSYLPPDSALRSSSVTVTRPDSVTINSLLHGTCSNLSSSTTLSTLNLTGSLPSNRFVPERDTTTAQTAEDVEMRSQGDTYPQIPSSSQVDHENPVRPSEFSNSSTRDLGLQPTTVNPSTVSVPSSATSSTTSYTPSAGGLSNFFTSPIMYVGSFRNVTAPVKVTTPMFEQSSSSTTTTTTVSHAEPYSLPTSCSRQDSVAISAGAGEKLEDLMSLPPPTKSYATSNAYGHGGEESDIGSVASSIASGSSLGEQITRYCRSTPGASLDIQEPSGVHELSVIMSDTSERRGFDSQLEDEEENNGSISYVRKEDWQKVVRPCSVPLERLDWHSKTDIYGKLDKDAVKSAEALHLMERNHEDCDSLSTSDGWKRKKRKTRQERETSGLTWRRRHWASTSSSDDGEMKEHSKSSPDINLSAVTSRQKREGMPSSQENDSSDTSPRNTEGKGTTHADQLKQELLSPSKSTCGLDITIAECDSSTNLGIVDTEGITCQANTLKEMRDSFVRTYGRSPRLSRLSQSQENIRDINSTSCDAPADDPISNQLNGSNLSSTAQQRQLQHKRHSLPPADSNAFSVSEMKTANQNCLVVDVDTEETHGRSSDEGFHIPTASTLKGSQEISLQKSVPQVLNSSSRADMSIMTCKFPCHCGPVLDIHVEDKHLYVAHSNHGLCIHDMNGSSQDGLVNKLLFPHLHCMHVTKLNETSTVIVGNGCELVFFKMEEEKQSCYNVDAVVKCLVMIGPLLYAGLDTGEIGLFDTKRMHLREKIICSDYPIHCLATAQEGATRLLCASAQDGTILVMDAHNCLPIRLLTGHTKTAFSIHADGSYLYSGSGDGTVIVHNIHTAAVEHIYKNNKGLVKSVFYCNGFLFTGGMDKLVRCYKTETHQLVQVLFGPERGVITKVFIHNKMIITGNIAGSVDVVELCPGATHKCSKKGCQYNFGNQSHLFWHLLKDHNITQE